MIRQWVKTVRANGSKVLLSINHEKLGSVPDVSAFVDQVVDAAVAWGVGFDETVRLFGEYAAAIGTPEKLAIGVSCMGPPPPATLNFTPLADVEKLCRW